ncbi:Maf family protein [Legionella spiritensis]|uniref:Nucleoside triphosphate pyrophosphatase n=1 Tax=Legionella spiritensis TaxID=452 RepID=A0A0W0YY53_LEGSP|nr:nucleoside triphosphate pyrophosphatase [Legionella spiritensis]KTD61550.1 Maf-like protein [Legionella spiritensis]SNV32555.1 septum formation protein [Legionella spiritensis]
MSEFITQQPLILASASQSRQRLLQTLGLRFEVVPSFCDEEQIKRRSQHSTHSELAAELAAAKALLISEEYPKHYVIAADQLCVFGDTVFDKPGDHQEAVRHLRTLRGKTHQQISACCIARRSEIIWSVQDVASLTMRHLSDQAIEAYLLADQPYQSCGAYHYEGKAKWLFSEVTGSDSTIQGLPVQLLIQALIEHRIVTL